jgi:hypothetical protein
MSGVLIHEQQIQDIMKIKSLLRNGAFILAATLLTLTACMRRDKTTNTTNPALTSADDNGGYASDAAKLETNSNDVISIADAAGNTGASNLRTAATTLGPCATVTNDTTVTPHVLTINFGTSDCTCADGKNRRGEIIVTYTGRYKDSGSTHTITYHEYFVNDNHVGGSKTVTNNGTNTSGQVYYTVTVNDSLTIGSDSVITQTGSRTRTWLDGYSTPERSDDKYLITGSTTVKRANDHTFTMNITTPLQVANDCPWIEAGVVAITGSSFSGTRTLDYGTGDCDSEADLTIGSVTYHITLR